jgi:hypothetical protein
MDQGNDRSHCDIPRVATNPSAAPNAPAISPPPTSFSVDGAECADRYLAYTHVNGNDETLIGFVIITVIAFALAKDPAIGFQVLADLLRRPGPMLRHWRLNVCV